MQGTEVPNNCKQILILHLFKTATIHQQSVKSKVTPTSVLYIYCLRLHVHLSVFTMQTDLTLNCFNQKMELV